MAMEVLYPPGARLIEDPYISDYVWKKRTWGERLFSWPWNPFNDLKKVYKPQFHYISNGIYLCSPRTAALVRGQTK